MSISGSLEKYIIGNDIIEKNTKSGHNGSCDLLLNFMTSKVSGMAVDNVAAAGWNCSQSYVFIQSLSFLSLSYVLYLLVIRLFCHERVG